MLRPQPQGTAATGEQAGWPRCPWVVASIGPVHSGTTRMGSLTSPNGNSEGRLLALPSIPQTAAPGGPTPSHPTPAAAEL